jgi:predicted small lipoprotein YifL
MKTVTALAAILGALALSAGCGQRGPLVLPDAEQARPPASKANSAQTPAR